MDQNYEILIKSPTLCPHSPPQPPPHPGLRKQPTFGDATTGFPAKWRQRDENRNSILMMHHYPDLGSASDWLNQISHVARPIRSTTQIWVMTCHQYGISALISQVSFGGETSGSIPKCPNPPLGFTLIGAYIRLGMRILHGWNWLSCSNELNGVSKIAPTISPFVKTELRQYFSELNNPTFLTCFTNIIEPLCCRQHLLRSLKNWVHPG